MLKKDFNDILMEAMEGQPQDNRSQDRAFAEKLMRDPNNRVVWRIFQPEQENSIFKNGYSSEYFGCGEGEYHGSGIYSFYDTRGVMGRLGTNTQNLGSKVMKCVILGGFKDFLILDRPIAIQYYGSDDIRTQINYLYDDEKLKQEILDVYRKVAHGYKLLPDKETTGFISKALYEHFRTDGRGKDEIRGGRMRAGKIRGIVYNGGRDHFASLLYNPREIIPISVTSDEHLGPNHDFTHWKERFTMRLWDVYQKVKDFASYGEKLKAQGLIRNYSKMSPENDCMMVIMPNGKDSMYDIAQEKFVSKYGFEKCFGWETIEINGKSIEVLPVQVSIDRFRNLFYIRKHSNSGTYYFNNEKTTAEPVMGVEEYDSVRSNMGSRMNENKILKEDHEKFVKTFGNGNYLNVYHRTKDDCKEEIATKGFSREYTGKNANAVGPGIYFTLSVRDSNIATHGFGPCMFECKLIDGLKGYLIPQGVTVNGHTMNKSLTEQLYELTAPEFRDEIMKKYSSLCGSNSAASIYKALLSNGDFGKTDIRGIIYNYGVWAGVAIDWKSIIPFRYSEDDGKSWNISLDKEGAHFMKNYADLKFLLNKYIARGIVKDTFTDQNGVKGNQQFVDGYARVELTNGNISFYSLKDKRLISLRGFNEGFNASLLYEDKDGYIVSPKEEYASSFQVIPVRINHKDYFIYREDEDEYWLYEEERKFLPLKSNGTIFTTDMYDRYRIMKDNERQR